MEQEILQTLRTGATASALDMARRWCERDGLDAPGVLRTLGAAALCAGDQRIAGECLQQAEKLSGLDAARLFDHWARACAMLGLYGRALQLARSALPAAGADPELACTFAEIALAVGRVDDARQALDRFAAPGITPGRVDELRARVCFKTGDADGARRHALAALASEPDSVAAFRVLGDIRAYGLDDALLGRFERRLNDETDDRRRVQIGFALGSLCETRAEYDRAFGHYRTANGAQARLAAASPNAALPRLEPAAQRLAERLAGVDPIEPQPGPVPVFVVGMPRSGTTLVEQALAQHPRVAALGERDELMGLALRLVRDGFPASADAAQVLRDFARQYLAAGGDAGWLVDKQPLNFAWLPLIRLVFPNARVIRMLRDPRDVCVSIYASPMRPQITLATDLDAITGSLEYFERCRQAERTAPDPRILEVDYDALTADFELELRRIAAHCGLEWSDALLGFTDDRRPVHTISATQVRQPVNRGSVGRWRRFERELAPWLPRLEALISAGD